MLLNIFLTSTGRLLFTKTMELFLDKFSSVQKLWNKVARTNLDKENCQCFAVERACMRIKTCQLDGRVHRKLYLFFFVCALSGKFISITLSIGILGKLSL